MKWDYGNVQIISHIFYQWAAVESKSNDIFSPTLISFIDIVNFNTDSIHENKEKKILATHLLLFAS